MKKYNTEFIKQYIEDNKENIMHVECGMREDWSWTADTVYSNGKYYSEYDWESESICVAGICGSTWATPIMEVNFKDGRTEIVECFKNDGVQESQELIRKQKEFAFTTGGMDYNL